MEETKQLERMLMQSFVRRSTEFDGTNNTHIITDNASRRRVSSAKSRESFFIPQIFKTIHDEVSKVMSPLTTDIGAGNKSPFDSKATTSENQEKLKVPGGIKGEQLSMNNIHSVYEGTDKKGRLFSEKESSNFK